MKRTGISAIIPARNEEGRIGNVIKATLKHVSEVIVVNDASTDDTATVAKEAGATVISNDIRSGYISSIKRGFQKAKGNILVTIDGDGEHDPEDIPKLVGPLLSSKAELVFGRRTRVPRPSERLINWTVKKRLGGIVDSGTGFRAISGPIARRLELKGSCTCGILGVEAMSLGARIMEVQVKERGIDKPRNVAWNHFGQFFRVVGRLMSS